MSLRLLYLCVCTSLLLSVAVAAPRPAPSAAAPSTVAQDSCYKTLKGVPEWCAQMFLKAVFADNRNGVTDECCTLLACVREAECANVLHDFCLPAQVGKCPGSPPSTLAPALTTGAAN
jgi:hypothetical protein